MKTMRLFIVMLLITVFSSTSYAGQFNKDGTRGTDAEPECDYASEPAFL